ncbi:filamentous hemagglutinin N-terminal domain-containing protein [Pseudomonas marginalis]|uniref:two-partner secretion domain-containing protein n=1 Tax=Pseudomonas marginalis TaxID=298 RepID=UPI003BA3DF47
MLSKKPSRRLLPATISLLAVAIFQASVPSIAMAQGLPTAGVVTQGQALINTAGGSMHINQSTHNAVIGWGSFDIASGNSVNFHVPAGGATLNQISGPASQIHGNLTSNGALFLVNPNGVLFGQGAQVNVGALVSSASHLDQYNFMNGSYHFTAGGAGTISNAGTITAGSGGYVVLAGAGDIQNTGTINVPGGSIQMVSADTFTLKLPTANPLLDITVDGTATGTKVSNSGTLTANAITLNAAQGVVSTYGTVKATSIGDLKGSVKMSGKRLFVNDHVESDGTITLNSQGTTRIEGNLIAGQNIEVNANDSITVANSNIESKNGAVQLSTERKIFMIGSKILGNDIHMSAKGGDASRDEGAVNILNSTLIASSMNADHGKLQINGDFDVVGPITPFEDSKKGVVIKGSTLTANEMAIKGSGSDGVHLAGGNTFVANDIDIVGVAPAGYLGDSFRTGDGVKLTGTNTFTALNKVNIKGDGERYGVSFQDTTVFNAANVSVTGNTELSAPDYNYGIRFNGAVNLQNTGNFEFVSNGEAISVPHYL